MSQMFKKLQNLLFEDEEVVEEEVINEPDPVKPAPRPVQTNTNTPRPVMHQVDPAPAEKPAPQVSFFRQEKPEPAPAPAPAPVQERPHTIGMTVDDVQDETMNLQLRPSSRPVTPAPQPKPQPAAQPKKKPQPVYEFSPVISPIFGFDEKDLDALKTSGKTQVVMPGKGKEDTNVSPVISPMYGMSKEAEPKTIQDTVEKSNELAENLMTEEKQKAEDSIPDFSLDDILKIRDDEYKETAEQATLFDDIIDETVIFDSDKYNRR